uniref:NADH-ubiquinone oxidoreductase chain 4 n=1 Tax=Glossosoma caudatum TaxID=2904899 RepID=A0A9E8LNI6_9NEOP|nr:NADH dehydrogenase subunit 4 [Glossosoma caudatum]UZZ43631.1 NADH dehydrogenase subunit 4 [Glossosoma caudatum]
MMKFIFMIICMTPLCLMANFFWMVQMCLFILMFIFMFMSINMSMFNNLSYMMGYDVISFGLILLSIWICLLMIMVSQGIYKSDYYYNFFLFNIILLLLMLVLTFSTLNLFYFYLFFESSLVPILLLIVGWGYQSDRIQAGVYLLFYTLLASLPLLMGIFYIGDSMNSLSIFFLKNLDVMYLYMYIVMMLAFLVKMPMFFVHLWLPKAHVEAPVSGSMMLAGVMLKLGGYGILRVANMMLSLSVSLSIIWVSISLIGGILVSLICFWQIDLKSLIAYSSVAHMGLVLSGMLTFSYWGMSGSYTLMIGHGLCSSGLFCLVGIIYERMSSRSMFINKGLLNLMPSMSLFWFLLVSSNMAAPPSLNLVGEISLFNSLIGWSWLTFISLMLISFLSAGYSLYLYSFSQHGGISLKVYFCSSGLSREYLMLFLHWFPLNILVLSMDQLFLWV